MAIKVTQEPLSKADDYDYLARRPELKGVKYGSAKVVSATVRVRSYVSHRKGREVEKEATYALVRCLMCRRERWVSLHNLTTGWSKGCRSCYAPRRFPGWLYHRTCSIMSRCRNPKSSRWRHYGGRGIEFRFRSAADMALWLYRKFGEFDRKLEIDRIDNDGHCERGNIRLSTRRQNLAHTRRSGNVARANKFRLMYPEVMYSDDTLRRLLKVMSPKAVLDRWSAFKAKYKNRRQGKSTPADPFVASLCKDF